MDCIVFLLSLKCCNGATTKTNTTIMTLRFGKYKGQQFKDTPKSYQNWLLNQDWFKAPKQEKPLHQQ